MFPAPGNHKPWLYACLVAGIFPGFAMAQTGIRGFIQSTPDKKALVRANVLLIKSTDSSLVKGTTSNDAGFFELTGFQPGIYLLQVSNSGFMDTTFHTPQLGELPVELGAIFLRPIPEQLDGVVVVAQKPLYEQKTDRMVINVKASPTNAGNTVLEVLEKSPGVRVNRSNQTISMFGKDGVNVMINGKINYMPQDAILQLLNGLNASMVEKIEIITIPPSKYDASGNAGYINIVMAENPNQGINGNYTLGMAAGKGTIPSASTNFNYRHKKTNLYGNYSFIRNDQKQFFENYRKVQQGANTSEISIINDRWPVQRNHNAMLGVDFQVNKKLVIGGLISGYDNKWSLDATNQSIYQTNGYTDTTLEVNLHEVNHWKNLNGNLNLEYKIKENSTLSINSDFLHYDNSNPTYYLNDYYNHQHQPIGSENTFSGKETMINVFVAQADFNKKWNNKTTLETGFKYIGNNLLNDVTVATMEQGNWIENPDFTGKYDLKEIVWAGYLSMTHNLGPKTFIQAGLRYEHTNTNLGSETERDIVNRQYGNLFPTLYLTQKLTKNQGLNVSYSRRIDRPSFRVLAPFVYFMDPKTFISGNPSVQPAITDAVKIDYLVKRFVFSVSYSYENNSIARFLPETNPDNNTQMLIAQNLDYIKQYNVNLALPVRITKWWYSSVNIGLTHSEVQGTYNKELVNFSQAYFSLNGNEIFTLPKKFTLEVKGNYTSKSIFWGVILKPLGTLDAALQKRFSKSSGILTVGVDNILNSNTLKTELSVPGQGIETRGSYLFQPVTYKIGWTQSFGNNSLKGNRNRVTGGDEVKKRVE